jgi:UDP-N-acetylmuramoylalanine--D-glutamate ligase
MAAPSSDRESVMPRAFHSESVPSTVTAGPPAVADRNRVAAANGVLFINDSKATNPASTAPALGAWPRVHWIVGGLPKSDDLDACAPYFSHVVQAYTIGEAGPRFADILEPVMPVQRSEMLCDAVRQAMEAAVPGDVIMLSPACASFDQFRDFEARGDSFRQIVAALTEKVPAEKLPVGEGQD